MRWRLIDRITRFEAWRAIEGRKAVSLEEYSLLEPLGRKGAFPESLMLESCVHLARWLVAASSGFERLCVASEVERFQIDRGATAGAVLDVSVTVSSRHADALRVACGVSSESRGIGRGAFEVSLFPLDAAAAAADMRTLWQELHGKTQGA
jgi:hypothetical protein